VLAQEAAAAQHLVEITQQRNRAGLDSDLELKKVRRALLQIQIQQPEVENDVATLERHLASLTGIDGAFPIDAASVPADSSYPAPAPLTEAAREGPAELASEATARARAEQAHGDERLRHIPTLAMQTQYGRISPINNVSKYYNLNDQYNVFQFGVAVQFPFFDRVRSAKAREAAAEAHHAEHEAELVHSQQQESHVHLQDSLAELAKRVELAELDRDIATAQLQAIHSEVTTDSADATGGRQMTPKDELFARLDERQRYIDWRQALLQLRKAQISLLRQNGELEGWLRGLEGRASAGGSTCGLAPACDDSKLRVP